eukprot:TRINITY_DN67760_c7_g1_i4.p1 TRINITY_DN67760_c7_g1~~TRINITY_DN67760_c7_g1_i4.p1  ORF type:complete len:384 (-),score=173.41 TRINITY_DN67760_c7_g1_i4:248-1399(-)
MSRLQSSAVSPLLVVTSEPSVHVMAGVLPLAQLSYVKKVKGFKARISDCCFVNGQLDAYLTACEDGTCVLWSVKSTKPVRKFKIPGGKPAMSCCSNGKQVVVAGEENIFFFDVNTSKLIGALSDYHTDLNLVRYHPGSDGKVLFSADDDGLINQFNLVGNDLDDTLDGSMNVEQTVARIGFFGAELEYMYCLTNVETLSLWHVVKGQVMLSMSDARQRMSKATGVNVDYLIDCVYVADQQRLFVFGGTNNGTVVVCHVNVDAISPVAVLKGVHDDVVRDVVASGPTIYTCGEDGKVVGWSCSGEVIARKKAMNQQQQQQQQQPLRKSSGVCGQQRRPCLLFAHSRNHGVSSAPLLDPRTVLNAATLASSPPRSLPSHAPHHPR